MMLKSILLGLMIVFAATCTYAEENIADYLQNISVTIKSDGGQGSGVLITRELKTSEADPTSVKVNFVWTAAHVVDNLRTVRSIIDPKTGTPRQVVEFRDAQIVQELKENGRRVGEIKMDAKVIRYSDANNGQDLALLMVRKHGFVDVTAKFYLGEEIPPIGSPLFHVGSLLGQVGANSMTSGIISQHGRVIQTGTSEGTVFDQTTVTAFPGSSGGGVFLSGQHTTDKWKANKGEYIGMLVRGAGEGFNFIVPVRRMREWADTVDSKWALDPAATPPTLDQIKKAISVEDVGVTFATDAAKADGQKEFKFWFYEPKASDVLKEQVVK